MRAAVIGLTARCYAVSRVSNGNVMVGNARVTATDVEATNGVIHGVKSVILPSAD